jgi:hypothetical protein
VYGVKWLFFGKEQSLRVDQDAATPVHRRSLAAMQITAQIIGNTPKACVALGCGTSFERSMERDVLACLREYGGAAADASDARIACVGVDIDPVAVYSAEEEEERCAAASEDARSAGRVAYARLDLRARDAHVALRAAIAATLAYRAPPPRTIVDAATGEEVPPELGCDAASGGGDEVGGAAAEAAAAVGREPDAAWDVDLLSSVMRPCSDARSSDVQATNALRDGRAIVREVGRTLAEGALWVSVATLDGRFFAQSACKAPRESDGSPDRPIREIEFARFENPGAARSMLTALESAWDWGEESTAGGSTARSPFVLVQRDIYERENDGGSPHPLLVCTLRRRGAECVCAKRACACG